MSKLYIYWETLVGVGGVQEGGFTFTHSPDHDHFCCVVLNMPELVGWQWMRFHTRWVGRGRCIVPLIVWSPRHSFAPGKGLSLLIGFELVCCSVSRGRCSLRCIAGGSCTHYYSPNRFVARIHLLGQMQNGPR